MSSYSYTYDDRGFIIGEVAKEARECDPYDRDNPYTPYRPEQMSKYCGHGKETDLVYRLVETARSFTYDDAGKLLSSSETVTAGSGENCGTSTWDYAYDLMGNRISEIRRDARGTVVENNHYVYNDSNQLVQAKLCDGKTTVCKKYFYDADGNLTEECSPDDPGLKKTYKYTVENRLAAVYDAHKLLMAAAYDGDGNRVFMLNYNPEKDEDFTDYYNSYQNKDYTGTGVLFPVCEEVGEAEQALLELIKNQENVKYELIEYLTDVNREYAQVLVEQNLNGKTDTTYTYGVDRISKELFDCESNTSYYLYDPRGSVTGLTNWKGQLCRTYQYDSYGELTRGKAQYENAYTYNGESYNPNIDTLYLRARYYSVVTANFLTEDSCLGKINEPLTLNRYSYCLASPLNYVDPSGHWVSINDIDMKNVSEVIKSNGIYSVVQDQSTAKSYIKVTSGVAVEESSIETCFYLNFFKDKLVEYSLDPVQLKTMNWANADSLNTFLLNATLDYFQITDFTSIQFFMGTILHESGRGTATIENDGNNPDYYKGKSYEKIDRGTGYMQITGKEIHNSFLSYVTSNMKNDYVYTGKTTAEEISKNWAYTSAGWNWAVHNYSVKQNNLNDFIIALQEEAGKIDTYERSNGSTVEMQNGLSGSTQETFLVTQYYINGWLKDYNDNGFSFNDIMHAIARDQIKEVQYHDEIVLNEYGSIQVEVKMYDGSIHKFRSPYNWVDRLNSYLTAGSAMY